MADKKLPSLLDRHWAESVLAIGAVIIAAVSLWVAYSTDATNRQLVSAQRQLVSENSWPFVQQYFSDATYTGNAVESVNVVNAGVGPARIETVEVSWRGKPLHSWHQFLRVCCGLGPPQASAPLFYESGIEKTVLRPGQTVHLLWFPKTAANAVVWSKAHLAVPRLEFRICYCSVFNECWLSDGDSLYPPRVQACPVPKVQMSD